MKFKVGDKVVSTKHSYPHADGPPRVGTVVEVTGSMYPYTVDYEDLKNILFFKDELAPAQFNYFVQNANVGEYPDNNPKTAIGVTKVPLHLVPPSAKHFLASAFADGAKKYGPYNWRDKTVSSSVYLGAAQRHMDAWWDGEAVSADAKVHHLAHAMACLAIVLDAETVGKLNDDRPTKGATPELQAQWGKDANV